MERSGQPVAALDVLWFNYPTYLAAFVALAAALVLLVFVPLPPILRGCVLVGAALGLWWPVTSTAVVAWVFGLSGVTRWEWIPGCVKRTPARWLNVTTGFDDTSSALRQVFPSGEGLSVDLFDERVRHDGAVRRARMSRPPAETSLKPDSAIPLASASCEAAFLLMAAHELRDRKVRRGVLTEVARTLTSDGRLVMVEHPRTALNAVAFGPGVFHFLGRQTWLEDANAAGLRLVAERPVTPFATAWTFEPATKR